MQIHFCDYTLQAYYKLQTLNYKADLSNRLSLTSLKSQYGYNM